MALVGDTFTEIHELMHAAALPSMPIDRLTRYSGRLFAYHVNAHRLLVRVPD